MSDADRIAFVPQARALADAEVDSEGTAEWRNRRIEEEDADRADHGIPLLKTDPELHRRARDLGLLRGQRWTSHI